MQTSEMIHPDKTGNQQNVKTDRMIGKVISFREQAGYYAFECENGTIAVKFVEDEMIRILASRGNHLNFRSTPAIVQMKDWNSPSMTVANEEDSVTIIGNQLRIVVMKPLFSITVYKLTGEVVYKASQFGFLQDGYFYCQNDSPTGSHFYGLGEKTSFLDKSNECYEMWNSDVYAPHVPEIDALYVSIPYLIHFQPKLVYGIFLDNPGRTIFDMRSYENAYRFMAQTGNLDYYVISGCDLKDITKRYSHLTGRMELPPKWALGYHQSRYSYLNQEEVLELARTFRDKQIPCDAIYLDIHYMDGYRVFTFDKARFPNPEDMIRQLEDMGFHLVPIVDPGVKRDAKYPVYIDGVRHNYFCKTIEGTIYIDKVWPGDSAFPDFMSDDVAQWWGQNHAFYTQVGIRGIWNDMNEPAVFNEEKTMNGDIVHQMNGQQTTHDEVHNLYGLMMTKATHQGLKKLLQGERPFVLTRSGYAGIQRYSAVWTGDNRSFWEHLALAIPMVLNLGLSGVPFSGPDIGGFAHHTTGELLARWTQMGAFFPFCRNHSSIDTVHQEPWSFGPEIENICKKYIQLRYQIMPYLYSLFYEASQTGLPMMRPLVLEYPEDENTYNLSDEFLLGSNFLVAPVYRPDTNYRVVYLPKGTWYDYWTGQKWDGEQHILVRAPLDTLPLFVRAGAIMPMSGLSQHALDKHAEERTIDIYLGQSDGEYQFTLYEDDGLTYDYQTGHFCQLSLQVKEQENQITLTYACFNGESHILPEEISVRFRFLQFKPRMKPDFVYNEETNELVVKISPRSKATLSVQIKCVSK